MNPVVGVARAAVCGALTLICLAALAAQGNTPTQYLSYAQAAPVFAALGAPLPDAAEWPRWIAAADAATRARVAEGDELSIVNLLMFGTSFTREPRLTSRQLDGTDIQAALSRRLDDFERALAKPDANARLQFARRLLQSGAPVRPRLLSMIDRAVKDAAVHAKLTEEAHALADPSLEFAERSRLYRGRGLASDTSLRVNFAIEEALRGLPRWSGVRPQTCRPPRGRDRPRARRRRQGRRPRLLSAADDSTVCPDRLAGSPWACRWRHAPGDHPGRQRQSERPHRGDGASSST